MVGVGIEELGVEDFVRGDYFKGDVYIASTKDIFKELGYKRIGFSGLMKVIFSRTLKTASSQAKKANISGNLKGDGYQNGGLIIVKQGGEVLLNWKQEDPSVHMELADILKAAGITEAPPSEAPKPTMVCDDQACAMK